jgi:hypothetical protein
VSSCSSFQTYCSALVLLSCLALAFKLWCSQRNILRACVYYMPTPADAKVIETLVSTHAWYGVLVSKSIRDSWHHVIETAFHSSMMNNLVGTFVKESIPWTCTPFHYNSDNSLSSNCHDEHVLLQLTDVLQEPT